MHEEPLHLIPEDLRRASWKRINRGKPENKQVVVSGALCPACRQTYRELNTRYRGDWTKIISH